MMTWPTGDRDTTEWPDVEVNIGANYRRHLQDFISIDGVDWSDYEKMDEVSEHSQTPQRWRSYRKMYERLGLIKKDGDKMVLTGFGRDAASIEEKVASERNSIFENLSIRAVNTLVRYQFKNPTDDSPDFRLLPDDCDMRPYYAIWKCMYKLDGKLHYEELNRVLLKVIYLKDLDEAVEKIRAARSVCKDHYSDQSSESLAKLLGQETITDQPSARMAAWFSLAGWGGLIIESSADSNGFRNFTPGGKKAVERILAEKLPHFAGTSKDEWYDYYSAPAMTQELQIHKSLVSSSGRANKVTAATFSYEDALRLTRAVDDSGFKSEGDLVLRILNSLIAKPFLILTGNSGTGKTKLAELVASRLSEHDAHVTVAVGAGWTDNRNVVGFVNFLRNSADDSRLPLYQSTPILNLLIHADKNKEQPHFLILDEMNLSHVERYFADFLSAMESSKGVIHLHTEGTEGQLLPLESNGEGVVPRKLEFPPNVFVIGTVNVDETTYMFSPKVLDRANVIEFRAGPTQIDSYFTTKGAPVSEIEVGNVNEQLGFLELAKDVRAGEVVSENVDKVADAVKRVFSIMADARMEFGFRTIREILAYHAADFALSKKEDWNWQDVFDLQLLQKIMPKLHGSKRKIEGLLLRLAEFCETGNVPGAESETPENLRLNPVKPVEKLVYPRSYKKLVEMIDAVRRDQFVSFIH
jgi:MoxR-like ATPase